MFVLAGGGWGHGVGMSQWGAFGQAKAGRDYRTILAHYYPGTTLGPSPVAVPSKLRVLVADGLPSVTVTAPAGIAVVDGAGRRVRVDRTLTLGPSLVPGVPSSSGAGRAFEEPVTLRDVGGGRLSVGGKTYRGAFRVARSGGALQLVNVVALEAYLRGVVPGEMPKDWPLDALKAHFPEIHAELLDIFARLERHYQDMCDTEFTIEQGKLWMLQTRVGKRTGRAALRMAVEMVAQDGDWSITENEALQRITEEHLDQVLHPQFAGSDAQVLTTGLAASPGAAVGQVYFTADDAVAAHERGEKVVLVRNETSPEDVAGMYASEGIVTARGGRTSHAAVVAVGMGKPCVVGASDIVVHEERRVFEAGGRLVREGEVISIDGETGEIILDAVERTAPEVSGAAETFLAWADRYRTLGVRANADTPEDAARARQFGAEGIGLVRTEHMFFAPDRIPIIREMIMAGDAASQQAALDKLLPFQRDDFLGIFLLDKLNGPAPRVGQPVKQFGRLRGGTTERGRPTDRRPALDCPRRCRAAKYVRERVVLVHANPQRLHRQISPKIVLAQQAKMIVRRAKFLFGPRDITIDCRQHAAYFSGVEILRRQSVAKCLNLQV